MTDDILDRVSQALDKVTEEPWEVIVETYSSDIGDYEAAYIPGVVEEGASGYDVEPYGPLAVPVAEFIVATRPLLSELADALRAARTENEQMYGFINRLGHPHMCEHPHAAPGDTWQCPNCQRTWKAHEWGPLDIRWETTR